MSGKRKLDDEEDASFGEEESDVQEVQKKTKTSSTSSKPTKSASRPSDDAVFELGNMRKVTVSVFKGRVLVNFREFYEDKATGEEKPGSKGIALSLDQWKKFAEQVMVFPNFCFQYLSNMFHLLDQFKMKFDEIKAAVDERN